MSALERVWTNSIEGQDACAITDTEVPERLPRAPPIPASVKINVEGAFIVDDEISDRNGGGSEFVHWEHKDIRLPHHTDVVSHVAVDVCASAVILGFARH